MTSQVMLLRVGILQDALDLGEEPVDESEVAAGDAGGVGEALRR